MVIQHNILAMYGNHVLGKTSGVARKSTEKLSSGYKINRAGDNAAGLAISEKMRGQIRGLDRTIQNAEDGISMVQTADGAMAEIEDIVHRMRELSVQAANDTNTTSDRQAIQEEIDELSKEIIRTANDTEFNTRKILKGSKQKTTKSVTGKIDDLRKVYNSVKNVQKIETMVSEQVKIPGGYTKSSMPGWALGTDPLYGATSTTKTGNLTEEIDFGEKQYRLMITIPNGRSSSSSIDLNTYNTVKDINRFEYDGSTLTVYSHNSSSVSMHYNYSIDDIKRQFGSYVANTLRNHDSCNSIASESPLTHNGGKMDFSNLNKNNIFDLVDGTEKHGFNATCTICEMHYSINLVNGTGDSIYSVPDQGSTTGKSWIYDVDISSLLTNAQQGIDVSGEDLVNRILDAVSNAPETASYSPKAGVTGIQVGGHHQALVKDETNPNCIIFLDTINYQSYIHSGSKYGIFDTTVYEGDKTKTIWKRETVNINLDNPISADPNKIYTMYYETDENKPLRIQVGANGGQELAMTMPEITMDKLGIEELNVLTHADAAFSIDRCDNAIDYINSERSRMGAYQNRMEHIVTGNSNTSENLQASESRIRDTDMAEEMTRFSKENILMQAGQSMLAQANQSKQGILTLLQ